LDILLEGVVKLNDILNIIVFLSFSAAYAMDNLEIEVNDLRRTPLQDAAFKGDVSLLSQLLKDESEHIMINYQDFQGRTALHYAVKSGSVKCVRILLAQDANPNIQDNAHKGKGYTLLHQATVDNQPKAASLLLGYGARADVIDAQGRTPGDLKKNDE